MITVRDIVLNAYHTGIAIPAFNVPYLPMVEPVIRATVDQDSFALIETARLEWFKFEAGGPADVMAEFQSMAASGTSEPDEGYFPTPDNPQISDYLLDDQSGSK